MLKNELRKARTELKLAVLAPHAVGKMTQTHCVKLGDLANNDNVLKAAAEFVLKASPSSAQFMELAGEAKSKSTEADQVAVFRTAMEPYEKGKSITIPRNVKKKFLVALASFEHLMERRSWQALEIQQNETDAIKLRLKDLQSYLNFLCKENG